MAETIYKKEEKPDIDRFMMIIKAAIKETNNGTSYIQGFIDGAKFAYEVKNENV